MDEAEDEAEDELPEFVPHPVSSESNMAETKRKNTAFRISGSFEVKELGQLRIRYPRSFA
jgi:hypothetical protein